MLRDEVSGEVGRDVRFEVAVEVGILQLDLMDLTIKIASLEPLPGAHWLVSGCVLDLLQVLLLGALLEILEDP